MRFSCDLCLGYPRLKKKANVLSEPLAALGIFMIGESAGGFVTYIKSKAASHKALPKPSASVQARVHCGMKALIVGHDPELISIVSALFHERSIEVRKCFLGSSALDYLSSEKFEAIVLDFDEAAECPNILRNLPRPNEHLVAIGVASNQDKRDSATRAGAMFVVERPLVP